MRSFRPIYLAVLITWAGGLCGVAVLRAQDTIPGDKLNPANYGHSYIESMEAAIERDRTIRAAPTWQTATRAFLESDVQAPLRPEGAKQPGEGGGEVEPPMPWAGGTAPTLVTTFQGVIRGDAGSMSYPPDTDGAIGPNHFVETVNRNFAVYNKTNGAQLVNILLGSFLPGSNGDPRVLFDHHSGRWIVIASDFSAGSNIYLAVSLTNDPTGSWFKTSFYTAQGGDAGKWPDYPTLGVDANGIYTAAYMVGGSNGMTIFAIDKAPLIAPSPSLGTITAFRNLPWEGAIQPAHTYGTPAGEYLISNYSSTALRIRRVNPPLTSPTLTEVGTVAVPAFSSPPTAPALGSTTPLSTVDERQMMAVYRGGSIWSAHTISASGRAGCRWYQINISPLSLAQSGTVADASLYYFFPSIMVNQNGDVAMGFSGSNASQYAACYYTGRITSDTLGAMATPIMYKAGTGPQNNLDGSNRNRWGDYSYTTLDPVDQSTFWTLQEYGHATNIWGTYIAVLAHVPPTGSCCYPDGSCAVTSQAGCTATWTPNGTCTPNTCAQPTGSCCHPNGSCTVTLQANCTDTWTMFGTCNPNTCVFAKGDVNCDHALNTDDVPYFVRALIGDYTGCDITLADMNGDGAEDGADIQLFVNVLLGV